MEWDTTSGTVAISTTTVRSGAAALRCNPTSSTGYITHQYRADITSAVYYRVYFRVATMPSTGTMILQHRDSVGGGGVGVYLEPDGTLGLYDAVTAATVGAETASGAITTGIWYRLELAANDDIDVAIGYLNGVNFSGIPSIGDFGGGGVVRVGPQDATTCDIFFDDLAVNDDVSTPTGAPTDIPGSGRIVHAMPDADGADKQWQSSASGSQGTSTFGAVDERTPNDATDYNRRTTTTPNGTPLDTWNTENASTLGIHPSAHVRLISVGVRAGSTSTTQSNRFILVRMYFGGGTAVEGAEQDISVNGWTTHRQDAPRVYGVTAYQHPDFGDSFYGSDVDDLQVGIKATRSSTQEIRYSTLWGLVEYFHAEPEAATGTGAAGQVTPTVAPPAGHPTGSGAANDATVNTAGGAAPDAEPAAGVGAANQPALKVTLEVGAATATAAANTPVPAVAPPAGAVTGAGTANQPALAVTFGADAATATGAAGAPVPAVAPPAGAATGAGTADNPAPAVAVAAGHATGTGAVENATVNTSSATNAPAGEITATGAANSPLPAITAPAADVAAAATANAPEPTVTITAPAAAGTGTATDAAVSAAGSANAEHATGVGTANQPTVTATSNVPSGGTTGAGEAHQPTISVAVAAAPATGQGDNNNNPAFPHIDSNAGHAEATGQAYQASPNLGTFAEAEHAAAVGVAHTPTLSGTIHLVWPIHTSTPTKTGAIRAGTPTLA
jgi:hypothetical protein